MLMTLLLLLAVCSVTGITYAEAVEKQKPAASVETSAGAPAKTTAAAPAETVGKNPAAVPAKPPVPSIVRKSVKISAVGDCTIG